MADDGRGDAHPRARLLYAAKMRRLSLPLVRDGVSCRLGDGVGRGLGAVQRTASALRLSSAIEAVCAGLMDGSSGGGRVAACAMSGLADVLRVAATPSSAAPLISDEQLGALVDSIPLPIASRFVPAKTWDALAASRGGAPVIGARDALMRLSPDAPRALVIALSDAWSSRLASLDYATLLGGLRSDASARRLMSAWPAASVALLDRIDATGDARLLRLHHALQDMWLDRQGSPVLQARGRSPAMQLAVRARLFGADVRAELFSMFEEVKKSEEEDRALWRSVVGCRALLYAAVSGEAWRFVARSLDSPEAVAVEEHPQQTRLFAALRVTLLGRNFDKSRVAPIILLMCDDCVT